MEHIRVKILKDKFKYQDKVCSCCGKSIKNCLDMYLFVFDKEKKRKLYICDECNEQLFFKTLKASVYTSTRLKDKSEIKYCNAKFAKKLKKKQMEDERLEWEEYYSKEENNDED